MLYAPRGLQTEPQFAIHIVNHLNTGGLTLSLPVQGSKVDERLYPAYDERGQPIQHGSFVRRLDALPAAQVRPHPTVVTRAHSARMAGWQTQDKHLYNVERKGHSRACYCSGMHSSAGIPHHRRHPSGKSL
jgi:hypothetical protein